MIKNYSLKNLLLIAAGSLLFAITSCKKDSKTQVAPGDEVAKPKTLGFYETNVNSNRILMMAVSKIGTQATGYKLVFDTGSGGMVMDANGILPVSMITADGFTFSGDSTVVNGITVTKQTSHVVYGDDNNTKDTVYGNLAYADVTVGDANGNIVVKHMPFFLYYKAVNNKGFQFGAHSFDVLGVSSEYDITFAGGAYITSPFSYYDPGKGLLRGFKMAALGLSHFSDAGTYVPALTLGLTKADINSGFSVVQLLYLNGDGYIPVVPGLIGVSNDSVAAEMLFDTGTSPYSYIMEPNAPTGNVFVIPTNSRITIATSTGFSYGYSVGENQNRTLVENPATSGSGISVFGLDFFIENEYLLDFTDHFVGIKKTN
ncbi:hypothetical protein [Mucilaginibacter ginsenosidivorans]|uniref:Aspartyl protease n=1 Tax=Mucilaginibacter ginsenosidivorans TaxID=398053 RepID=A0A5B8UWI2_9SPHI|nr:hypothetical protein [Mucilaginibacter ginsenosidivorans]QEC63490.1 hypothetical protein FRZ54_13180 [Mucilaginibacter ginsenosidivorans]